MLRRILASHMAILAAFCLLAARIFMIGRADYSTAAVKQSSYVLAAGSTRGMIYDCQLKPLVNRMQNHYLAVDSQPQTVNILRQTLPPGQFAALLPQLQSKTPLLIRSNLQIAGGGIVPLTVAERYTQGQIAPHVIGYVDGDDNGVCGIEAGYNDELARWGGNVKVRYAVNALNMPIGKEPELLDSRGSLTAGVVLTLDRELQAIAEKAAERLGKGAVVLMKVDSGEIRAMASVPNFDVNHVASALKAKDSPLLNRATSAWSVGSLFKVCVTAAALENKAQFPKDFVCPGFYQLGDRRYYCHDRAGHGKEDLLAAFEQSCNPYFIEIGRRTGASALLRMASAMGFGTGGMLAQGINTAAGTLPEQQMSDGELANFSFGQGKLTATPVQAARMISIVANGGYDVQPTLFSGMTPDGSSVDKALRGLPLRVLSVGTAETIRELMTAVVTDGTGKKAQNVYCGAGGKTASAQTGTYEDGREIVHAWFGGFFPAEEPEYALVVFQEGGQSGGQVPAEVFREISEAVYLHEHPELARTLSG